MQGDNQVTLAIVVGFAGFTAGDLSEEKHMDFFVGSIIAPLVTLAAAFFGAWYAFKLHDEKDKRAAPKAMLWPQIELFSRYQGTATG